ncbi:MAG: hypothetical protein QG606_391 [Patescibacteria group bacterium]|nr:hypothetical protein [Patescibacteria group bacterium]
MPHTALYNDAPNFYRDVIFFKPADGVTVAWFRVCSYTEAITIDH